VQRITRTQKYWLNTVFLQNEVITMSSFTLQAHARADKGKGASRRLRRLNDQVPAILYGDEKNP
jgi:hypothetical protein